LLSKRLDRLWFATNTAEAEPIVRPESTVKAKRGSKEKPNVGKGGSVGATKAKAGQQALFGDEPSSKKQAAPLKKKPARTTATRKRT
jgi:DNA topoisomerase-6 subunit B